MNTARIDGPGIVMHLAGDFDGVEVVVNASSQTYTSTPVAGEMRKPEPLPVWAQTMCAGRVMRRAAFEQHHTCSDTSCTCRNRWGFGPEGILDCLVDHGDGPCTCPGFNGNPA